jgi:hydroxymethylglutaryl-CoA reductase (NADPH)
MHEPFDLPIDENRAVDRRPDLILAPTREHPGPVPGRGQYTAGARRRRLDWIRERSGAPLETLEEPGVDARRLTSNLENFVGTIEVPVGLAGPLLFAGEHATGYITAPLATTEGALVASTCRGAKAVGSGDGVVTRVLHRQVLRAPFYEFKDLGTALRFVRWVEDHLPEIREQAEMVTRHGRLLGIEPLHVSRSVHLRFAFDTADAAGQNMVTACSWHACQWINRRLAHEPGLEPLRFVIEGGASGDKNPSRANLLGTRGLRVTAECRIDGDVVREVLNASPEEIAEVHYFMSSALHETGALGTNYNAPNIVAGLFTATGQDIASTGESSVCNFHVRLDGDELYVYLEMPHVVLGTVGGGTGLPGPNDYLEMLGCAGNGGSARLAEIVAGFTLALNLSSLGALASGEFAAAHDRLGRNRPVDHFTRDELTPGFFAPMLGDALARPDLEVADVAPLEMPDSSAVLSQLGGEDGCKLVGLAPFALGLEGDDGPERLEVMVKSKALDDEMILGVRQVWAACSARAAEAFDRHGSSTSFTGTHLRELSVYRSAPPALRDAMPRVYGIHEDPEREAYLIVMEHLADQVILKDSANDISGWGAEHVEAAVRGLARAHAAWLGREEELLAQPWLGWAPNAEAMAERKDYWLALVEHNAREYPQLLGAGWLPQARRALDAIGHWWTELERMPRTLIHGDFTPRNLALRRDGLGLVAYDWELATLHVPQRDLVELLAFVLPPDVDAATVDHHVEAHRRALEEASGIALEPGLWRRGFQLALTDFALDKWAQVLALHTVIEQPYVERVTATMLRFAEIVADRAMAA